MLTRTLGHFRYTEKIDMYFMHDRANNNGRAEIPMYHAFLFNECRITKFLGLNQQLSETGYFYLMSHEIN